MEEVEFYSQREGKNESGDEKLGFYRFHSRISKLKTQNANVKSTCQNPKSFKDLQILVLVLRFEF